MDWQNILTIAGIVAFVFLMMRGCGGMMGGCGMGGCGMGSWRPRRDSEERDAGQEHESTKAKR